MRVPKRWSDCVTIPMQILYLQQQISNIEAGEVTEEEFEQLQGEVNTIKTNVASLEDLPADFEDLRETVDELTGDIASLQVLANNHTQEIQTLEQEKQDKLTFDTEPTEGSSNPVTSDGIAQAIKQAGGGGDAFVGRPIPSTSQAVSCSAVTNWLGTSKNDNSTKAFAFTLISLEQAPAGEYPSEFKEHAALTADNISYTPSLSGATGDTQRHAVAPVAESTFMIEDKSGNTGQELAIGFAYYVGGGIYLDFNNTVPLLVNKYPVGAPKLYYHSSGAVLVCYPIICPDPESFLRQNSTLTIYHLPYLN